MTQRLATDLVRHHFSDQARRAGARLPIGDVYVLDARPVAGGMTARVSPLHEHVVTARWQGADAPGSCSCEQFEREGPCEHMWALFRLADVLSGGRGVEVRGPTEAPLDPPWAQRLTRLLSTPLVAASDPWPDAAGEEAELRYQVTVPPRPRRDGEILLRVVRRVRLGAGRGAAAGSAAGATSGAGRWGDPRPATLAQLEPAQAKDELDRRVLSLLAFGSTGAYRYYARTPGTYELTDAVAGELLPDLARAGRLDTLDRAGRSASLGWDSEEPWRFEVAEARAEDRGVAALVGALVRPGQRLGLDEVRRFVGRRLVETTRGLAPLDVPLGATWLHDLWHEGPLEVPLAEVARLRELVARTPRALAATPTAAEVGVPSPRLFVSPSAPDDKGSRVECKVSFDYGALTPVPPEEAALALPRADGTFVTRDLPAERARLLEWLSNGGRRTKAEALAGGHGTLASKRVPEAVRALLALGWSVAAEGREMRQATRSRVRVSSGIDWFEVRGGVDFGPEFVPFPRLLEALKRGANEVPLGDGSTGVLPEEWLARWGLLELADGAFGDALTFQPNQGWLLDALLAERKESESDEGFAAYRARLATFRELAPEREPPGFQGELREYQRAALGWFTFLRQMGLGGCLADDMGLGKTVQVLALLEARRAEGGHGPSLVVAPRSLVFNWVAEAARFAPALRVLDYSGADRTLRLRAGEHDLVVTTYTTLRLDAPELAEESFDYVVLDEATAIKNDTSQAAKAARLLRARHRLALSGTPVENHIGELWSLLEFLNPGMLGRATRFKRLCARGAEHGARAELVAALRPFFLRRTKSQVLAHLPPKSEQVIHCELSAEERTAYDELREHYRAELLADGQSDERPEAPPMQVLEALLRLRQAACHHGLVDPRRARASSAKLDELLPRLSELVDEGHKALVFSQFTSFLALVRARLDAAGIRCETLDGKTKDREARVRRFQEDPDCPVFLISLKAGGVGLNLTASDYVFLLDPWWNPAVEAQAIDRAHRLGQTRPVMAYRLIARDTIEEHVMQLQATKRDLADALFGAGRLGTGKLTRADLAALLQ